MTPSDIANLQNFYKTFHQDCSIPEDHIKYLHKMQNYFNLNPLVIYDIGSNVLHWTKEAKKVWPNSKYIAFEAVTEFENFYKEYGIDYTIGVFSDEDNKEVIFYSNPMFSSGSSYYKENSIASETLFSKEFETKRFTNKIDTIVKEKKYPLPDFLKIDVQGAEVDILKGMKNTLKNVKHLIVELQLVEYNLGAKLFHESIPYIESLGFELVPVSLITDGFLNKFFCGNGPDADFHFIKKELLP